MTWVIGAKSLFGRAYLVSDIRITYTEDNETKTADCLQKVYPLGKFIAGGFAGSVRCGFQVLSGLTQILDQSPPNEAWDLEFIVNNWLPRDLKSLFDQCPENEKANGCAIILAGAHPTKGNGVPGQAITEVYSFLYPEFKPVRADGTHTISIGSGSYITAFTDATRTITSDFAFHQMIVGNGHGQARMLAHHISETVRKTPEESVAPFFQVTTVTRGEILTADHEYITYPRNRKPIEHKFPPVARSWKEFRNWCEGRSISSEGCIC